MYQSANFTTEPITTTKEPVKTDDVKYLIIPLVVIALVMLLSVLVYLMAKRRRMNNLRNTIIRMYDFDSNEQEWESLTSNEYPYYNTVVTTNF
ncbi:hypothetical protein NQ314_007187 [Rhamnusium bicolor]|uniref:Uncharacterized protein n=1 Tax=Rhamnusium bicolor TaxID=1586634 RepID=A0AAV8YT99_9CUCU|nr:hypothetical protein NQ314_007187 [Rhamnusium bicolor]